MADDYVQPRDLDRDALNQMVGSTVTGLTVTRSSELVLTVKRGSQTGTIRVASDGYVSASICSARVRSLSRSRPERVSSAPSTESSESCSGSLVETDVSAVSGRGPSQPSSPAPNSGSGRVDAPSVPGPIIEDCVAPAEVYAQESETREDPDVLNTVEDYVYGNDPQPGYVYHVCRVVRPEGMSDSDWIQMELNDYKQWVVDNPSSEGWSSNGSSSSSDVSSFDEATAIKTISELSNRLARIRMKKSASGIVSTKDN